MSLAKRQVTSAAEWDSLVLSLPNPHLLQSWLWGEIKALFGWRPERWVWEDAGGQAVAAAQVLERRLSGVLPLGVLYAPKGPLLGWEGDSIRDTVLDDLESLARRRGIIQLKIDPDLPVGYGLPGQEDHRPNPTGKDVMAMLTDRRWTASDENIQFANTMIVDLRHSEEELLADMKQKTRYNVRLAGRKGVDIRVGKLDDFDLLYQMYAETSLRDGFVIRGRRYYQEVWGRFIQAGQAQPLIAVVDGEPVAALIVYAFGPTAWYMYGMSRETHREKMPNYLLQWEAMRWAKTRGCLRYDLWGAPDEFDESDPMWGVYRFKDGFNARVMRSIGPWDYAPNRLLYWAYTVLLPRALSMMRRRGRRQTAEILD
jgi:lipid II:glycine glycyltransferase (peptidoglycan interpeptide bridge formation enzyme)